MCAATGLGVIVYNRPTPSSATDRRAAGRAEPELHRVQGRVGDIEQLTRAYATNGDRLFYVGGLPTAETFALPLLQLGMSTYSSAMYNFVPAVGPGVLQAVRAQPRRVTATRRFVLPYLDIRDRRRGTGCPSSRAA